MNKIQSKTLFRSILAGVCLAIFYLAILKPTGALAIPNLKAQDLFFKIRKNILKPPAILDQIALIIIDDESIEKLNQKWPFQRKVFAELIQDVAKANPRVLASDFVFSGKSDPVDDFLLASAIEQAGSVVLASFVDTNGNYILPHNEFLSQAAGVGIINKIQDQDLTVRRANMGYLDADGKTAGLPWEVEIARIASGVREVNFHKPKIRINYRFDFKKIKPIQFWKLKGQNTRADLESQFEGKIVLIGTTSKILHDFYHTPLGLMPGVVINMNLLASILSQDFLKPLPLLVPAFFLFLLSFFGIYLSLQLSVLPAFLIYVSGSLLFLLFSFVLFLNNFLSDYFTPLLFGWLGFITVSFYRYFFTLLENIQLRTKVSIDPLTGLYNRRFLEPGINTALERSGEIGISVLMIDIDNFKAINDTYGHPFGDDVLKNVSFIIKEQLRANDIAVRYGGEEFCIVLSKTGKDEAVQIGERMCQEIAKRKFSYVNQVARFTVSVGVASSAADKLPASRSLIRAADRALYHAKKTGKNRVSSYQND